MKRWFIPAAARARGQSNDLNREIMSSNIFNCHKEVINAPPVPSISRCIHIVYRHKNVWEYQWSNFIYNCMSTFLHYVRCKDALLDCSAPGGERCESLTWVDEIGKGILNTLVKSLRTVLLYLQKQKKCCMNHVLSTCIIHLHVHISYIVTRCEVMRIRRIWKKNHNCSKKINPLWPSDALRRRQHVV